MLIRLLPHFALLLAMSVWATSFIALKVGLAVYSPAELMAGRMAVATLLFAPWARTLLREVRARRHWGLLALMMLCEPCLYFLFETHALRYTSASQAGMIVAVLPVTVTLAAWAVLRERTGVRIWLGFALAVTGVIWLSLDAVRTENAPRPLLGNTLEVLAMLCATGYTICLKRLCAVYTPIQLTALQSASGLTFFVPLALLLHSTAPLPATAFPAWLAPCAVLYLGSIVTLGGYGLYNYGVSRLSAGQASAYTNLIPVITLALGVLLLHDVFVPSQYAASALVIAGVLLSQRRARV